MKKVFAIFAAVALALSLAACGGTQEDTTPTQGATGGQEAPQQQTTGGGTQSEIGQQPTAGQEPTPTPEPEPEPTPEPEPEGPEVMMFGGMEWYVTNLGMVGGVRDGQARLLLRQVLEQPRPFNADGRWTVSACDYNWVSSDLHTFLHGEFLENFTTEELGRIVGGHVELGGDFHYYIDGDGAAMPTISDDQIISIWVLNGVQYINPITLSQCLRFNTDLGPEPERRPSDELHHVRPSMWIYMD